MADRRKVDALPPAAVDRRQIDIGMPPHRRHPALVLVDFLTFRLIGTALIFHEKVGITHEFHVSLLPWGAFFLLMPEALRGGSSWVAEALRGVLGRIGGRG